jgi:hypothetical protein
MNRHRISEGKRKGCAGIDSVQVKDSKALTTHLFIYSGGLELTAGQIKTFLLFQKFSRSPSVHETMHIYNEFGFSLFLVGYKIISPQQPPGPLTYSRAPSSTATSKWPSRFHADPKNESNLERTKLRLLSCPCENKRFRRGIGPCSVRHAKVPFPTPPDPWPFLPFKLLSLSLFISLSRLCQCVTGFLPTFLLSSVRAVLLVKNCLLLLKIALRGPSTFPILLCCFSALPARHAKPTICSPPWLNPADTLRSPPDPRSFSVVLCATRSPFPALACSHRVMRAVPPLVGPVRSTPERHVDSDNDTQQTERFET